MFWLHNVEPSQIYNNIGGNYVFSGWILSKSAVLDVRDESTLLYCCLVVGPLVFIRFRSHVAILSGVNCGLVGVTYV